jgi:four helix bundle protein
MAISLYRLTSTFPPEERWNMTSQATRAGNSVAQNVAEGYGRKTRGEYLQFLGIARGSLNEVETLLVIIRELGYGDEKALIEAERLCTSTGKLLGALFRSLKP